MPDRAVPSPVSIHPNDLAIRSGLHINAVHLGSDVVNMTIQVLEDYAVLNAERQRLEKELQLYKRPTKDPFITANLPSVETRHNQTVQLYREQLLKFRTNYHRLAAWIADELKIPIEELCEAHLFLRITERQRLEEQLAKMKWDMLGLVKQRDEALAEFAQCGRENCMGYKDSETTTWVREERLNEALARLAQAEQQLQDAAIEAGQVSGESLVATIQSLKRLCEAREQRVAELEHQTIVEPGGDR